MRLFLIILIAVGLTLVFDARHFSKNYFSDSDKNKVINAPKSANTNPTLFMAFITLFLSESEK